MSISISGVPVHDLSDRELFQWIDRMDGYRVRDKTALLWVSVLRAFDEAGPPMTVRQIYYALVSMGAIPKTEAAYNQTCYHILQMRRRGAIPYSFISDNTRWMRKPDSYDSLSEYLKISKQAYRRALWADQQDYVEIWIEKDALAGVAFDITSEWDVPLMVTRGFPSETFVYEAAESMKGKDKPIFIYYFGDYDPSGVAIPENIREKLSGFGVRCAFEVVAVLPYQIRALNLPTRPTKRSDSRAKNWEGGSVELDAIPVRTLREMFTNVIQNHIDREVLKKSLEIEEQERNTFALFVDNFGLA